MTKKLSVAETKTLVTPERVKFFDTTVGKTVKTALYLAISAVVAGVLADIQNNPALFGVYTPIVNLVLVLVRNLASPTVKNI